MMASEAEIEAAARAIGTHEFKQHAPYFRTGRRELAKAALEAAERVRYSHPEWNPDADTCKQCGVHMDDLPSPPESKSK
jgi:hypothetical protein